jgi:hypothetical protein
MLKIDFGHGAYLEGSGGKLTKWHRRPIKVTALANTSSGRVVLLECGHKVMTFGDLEHARQADGAVWLLCRNLPISRYMNTIWNCVAQIWRKAYDARNDRRESIRRNG